MIDFEQLKQLAMSGKLSRREFITYSIAAGISLSSASALFPKSAHAVEHKKGGHFKMGIGGGGTSDEIDPATVTHTYTQIVTKSWGNFLTEIDNKGDVIPELAESWESSPDAKVWTFKVRGGISFHNGKELTADDVVASLHHHTSDDSKSAAKAILANINAIKADGSNVVIELKGGDADLPFTLSDYHLPIMPSSDGKVVDANSGIGTGPYILESFDPGVRAMFKRNPNYWKSGRAHFDSVELLSIKDVAARTNALVTGEIHAMDRCDLKTVHLLKRRPGIKITTVDGFQHYTLPMHAEMAPFDDNNVRLAVKHAIDREALVETILRGYGSVGKDVPVAASQKFYNKDLQGASYDPDKAQHYLKQAGMSSLKVTLSAADAAFAGAVDTATLVREHAAKAGIDVTIERVPNDGYWTDVWLKRPWCMSYWGGRPTVDSMFTVAFTSSAEWNEGHWKNENFDALLAQARSELDEAKRQEMYNELQQMVASEGSVVIPMFASYVGAVSDKVVQDDLGNNWDLDGLRATERWSFA